MSAVELTEADVTAQDRRRGAPSDRLLLRDAAVFAGRLGLRETQQSGDLRATTRGLGSTQPSLCLVLQIGSGLGLLLLLVLLSSAREEDEEEEEQGDQYAGEDEPDDQSPVDSSRLLHCMIDRR